jgi:hypothetical protein
MKPYKNEGPIRLVLADVDGTLVTQKKLLTPKTRQVVAKSADVGIAFAITSGRPPRGMQSLIRDLNVTTVVAGFNGGVFVTPRLDPIVMRDLPKDATDRALELIGDHGLVAWLYTDTAWYVQDPNGPHVDRESKTVGFGPEVTSDYSGYLAQAAKIVGVSDDFQAVAACERKVGVADRPGQGLAPERGIKRLEGRLNGMLSDEMRNAREPLGLVNREVCEVLDLRLPSYGHCKQRLCQLVGHIADQQEQLVDAVQCRADRVGVQQVADSHLCPGGQLGLLVPRQDTDRRTAAQRACTTAVPALPVPPVTKIFIEVYVV